MELLDKARARDWYHTIELAPGEVMEGMFDMRPYVDDYALPARMDGMRALDVGTFDGFWAFEMERRGADVVALDLDSEEQIDYPPRRRPKSFPDRRRGEGFELARELLGSNVERVGGSIYHATPEQLGGQFDLVLFDLVLIHLRDQVLALERIADLCRGSFISVEPYDPVMDLLPFAASRYKADRDADVVFWEPGSRTWKRLIWSAGFDDVERRGRFRLPSTRGFSIRCVVHHATR